jgi:hypothetical protein
MKDKINKNKLIIINNTLDNKQNLKFSNVRNYKFLNLLKTRVITHCFFDKQNLIALNDMFKLEKFTSS